MADTSTHYDTDDCLDGACVCTDGYTGDDCGTAPVCATLVQLLELTGENMSRIRILNKKR